MRYALNGNEFGLAFLPLAILFLLWRLSKMILAGRWRGVRMKPPFGGKYRYIPNSPYWLWAFIASLIWAGGYSAWVILNEH